MAQMYAKDLAKYIVRTKEEKINKDEILEAIEVFRSEKNPPYKAYEDTYLDGWLDACNDIYSEVFSLLDKGSEK